MNINNRVGFDSSIKHVSDTIEYPRCPECGDDDVQHIYQSESFLAPECDYWQCVQCGHQWGVE